MTTLFRLRTSPLQQLKTGSLIIRFQRIGIYVN